jgi:hypothetical protein
MVDSRRTGTARAKRCKNTFDIMDMIIQDSPVVAPFSLRSKSPGFPTLQFVSVADKSLSTITLNHEIGSPVNRTDCAIAFGSTKHGTVQGLK